MNSPAHAAPGCGPGGPARWASCPTAHGRVSLIHNICSGTVAKAHTDDVILLSSGEETGDEEKEYDIFRDERDALLKVLSFPEAVTSAHKEATSRAFHELTLLNPVSLALVLLCQLHISLTTKSGSIFASLSLRPGTWTVLGSNSVGSCSNFCA